MGRPTSIAGWDQKFCPSSTQNPVELEIQVTIPNQAIRDLLTSALIPHNGAFSASLDDRRHQPLRRNEGPGRMGESDAVNNNVMLTDPGPWELMPLLPQKPLDTTSRRTTRQCRVPPERASINLPMQFEKTFTPHPDHVTLDGSSGLAQRPSLGRDR